MTVNEGAAGLGDRHFPRFLSALPSFKSRGVGYESVYCGVINTRACKKCSGFSWFLLRTKLEDKYHLRCNGTLWAWNQTKTWTVYSVWQKNAFKIGNTVICWQSTHKHNSIFIYFWTITISNHHFTCNETWGIS